MNLQKEIARRGLRMDWIARKVTESGYPITPQYLSMIVSGQRNLSRKPHLRKKIERVITGRAA